MFLTFFSIIFCIVLFFFVISLCKISAQADRDINKIWRRREFSNSITGDIVLEEITIEDEHSVSSTKLRKTVNF